MTTKQALFTIFASLILGFTLSKAYLFLTHDEGEDRKFISRYSHMGGDFTLTSSQGPLSLKDLEGQRVILYFGFTRCPDVCPLSLQKLASMLTKINKKDYRDLKVYFVSVDWKRDTPEKIKEIEEYSTFFHPFIKALAGTKDQIEDLVNKYGASFEFKNLEGSSLDYTVDHTSRFYFINKKGILIDATTDDLDIKKFKEILKRL